MAKGFLVILFGTVVAFVSAFAIVALTATGEINPMVDHQQYIHLRGLAFLLFFVLCVPVGYVAIKVIEADENRPRRS